MIQHGVKPVKRDIRDWSFHRTFPQHHRKLGGTQLPLMIYNYDAGFGMPDQNADGFPNGCTSYCNAELCQDQDKVKYDHVELYERSLDLSNGQLGDGVDARDALSVLLDPGPKTLDTGVYKPRTGYFTVDKAPGYDWFDSIRIALRSGFSERKSISLCTPWLPEFDSAGTNGVVPMITTVYRDSLPYHDHKISGEILINGVPYLCDKSWQGATIGDRGWLYFGREQINTLMDMPDCGVFVVTKVPPEGVQTIALFLYERLFILLKKIVNLRLHRTNIVISE